MTTSAEIIAVLREIHHDAQTDEYAVQDAIAAALERAGIDYWREVKIAPRCRIDFVCPGNIGIEVKRGKPNRAAVAAQVQRYARSGLTEIILCIDRVVLPVQAHIPVHLVSLNMNNGVAS